MFNWFAFELLWRIIQVTEKSFGERHEGGFQCFATWKNRIIMLNRTDVFSDSINQSVTRFSDIYDITSFTYNAIHNVYRNTGRCLSHNKRAF